MLLEDINRSKAQLVVLEDAPEVCESLRVALTGTGFTQLAFYPAQSTYLAAHLQQSGGHAPDLVLFGLQPELESNWENLGRVRAGYRGPLIALTERFREDVRARAAKLGIPDYLPWAECGEAGLELKIESVLAVHRVEDLISENDHRVQRLFVNILTVMVKILESKDPYTRFHSISVAMWSRVLGRRKGLGEDQLLRLSLAGVFHDFGKIGIPEDILNKPMRLSDEEFAVMMHHPRIARDLLSSIDLLSDLLPAITHHHERWDGRGYPDGLKGEESPLWARIIGIADAYDTMASRRTYKEPMGRERIIAEFVAGRGTQFDPELADAMIQILQEKERSGESGRQPAPL